MSKKTIIFLCLLILSPIIIYFLWPSDENRIKKLFREGAKAVQEENLDEVMSKVSFNYSDDHSMTYLTIKDGMKKVFQQMDSISVEYEIKNIEIRDKAALVELDLRVVASFGQDTGYVLGDIDKPAHMTFYLDKERGKWLVGKTKGIRLYF